MAHQAHARSDWYHCERRFPIPPLSHRDGPWPRCALSCRSYSARGSAIQRPTRSLTTAELPGLARRALARVQAALATRAT